MRRPSILFMNRVYPPVRGASGRVLRDLARSFSREGWRVSVVTSGPHPGVSRDGGIRVITVKGPIKPAGALSYLWVLMKMTIAALQQQGAHLLVTMSDPPLLIVAGRLVRFFKGGRHMNWCHDLYPDIFPALGVRLPWPLMPLLRCAVRSAMRSCDKVIVIGRCMAKTLTESGVDPRHLTVIPNWPEFELTRSDGSAAEGIPVQGRALDGVSYVSGPRFRVLYAGNLGLAHPIETILDAAQILNESHPEVEFVFVGDGPRFDEIVRERARRQLDNIRLLPYQPLSRLREVMESGDVHLISVKEEAAGMLVPSKLYAALAVQRPCIFVGPAQSETAKVITDFHAGVVVAQGDAKALAARVSEYLNDGGAWFSAQEGAVSAGQIFVPKEAIEAWIERAWAVVESDLQG